MSTILCIGVVCILLSGCGAENSSQGERDTEQSVQNQTVVENQSQDAKIEAVSQYESVLQHLAQKSVRSEGKTRFANM